MKVKILDSCNGCGTCEAINSSVFKITNGISHVNEKMIVGNENDCLEAATQCPVSAIEISD